MSFGLPDMISRKFLSLKFLIIDFGRSLPGQWAELRDKGLRLSMSDLLQKNEPKNLSSVSGIATTLWLLSIYGTF